MNQVSLDNRTRERLVLWVLAAAQFINIIDFVIIMPLGPRLMPTLGINPSQFGMIVSVYAFSAAAAGLLAALFIDRFDRKTAFLTVFTGFSLGTLCCALAPDYATLLVARAVTGAFGGMLGGLAMTIVGDIFPDERRGSATGVLMSAFGLASVVGVPMGLKCSDWFDDWHAPFWMLGIPSLGVLALAGRFLPHLRGHLTAERPNPLVEIRDTISRPVHLRAFALIILMVGGALMVVPYLGTFFVANVGVAKSSLHWIYVVGGAAALVSSPLIGKLADRMGRFPLFCGLVSASAAMMLCVTILPRLPLAIVAAATAGLMVANSGRMIVAMTMVNARIAPRHRGSFMSVNSSLQHLASGLGAYAGGQIIGSNELGELTNFGVAGAVAAFTALASIGLAAGLRPRVAAAPSENAPAEFKTALPLGHDVPLPVASRPEAA